MLSSHDHSSSLILLAQYIIATHHTKYSHKGGQITCTEDLSDVNGAIKIQLVYPYILIALEVYIVVISDNRQSGIYIHFCRVFCAMTQYYRYSKNHSCGRLPVWSGSRWRTQLTTVTQLVCQKATSLLMLLRNVPGVSGKGQVTQFITTKIQGNIDGHQYPQNV